MDEFAQAVKDVDEKCEDLLKSQLNRMAELPKEMPLAGIYILSEGVIVLYAGRTNNMRKRLQYHMRNSHNQATFAFLLAREKTDNMKATYRKEGSRSHLLSQPAFRAAFESARARIKRMNIQFIEESDPVRQALLEICAAIRTKAKYNAFDNH